MKKITNYLIASLISLISLSACNQTKTINLKINEKQNEIPEVLNPLILNEDGSYGGTLNRSKYGTGAPLNGQYDVVDSPYYTTNDFYFQRSTNEKIIYSNFKGYQQTMKDSSGLACLLSAFTHVEEYPNLCNELELVKMYENLNNTTVYKNGTSPKGLANLLTNLGYKPTYNDYVSVGSSRQEYVQSFKEWIYPKLEKGEMVLVRYQDNEDNRYRLIIGYDTMGTDDYFTDDVVIFMDPRDGFDHKQDGYSIEAAGRFERWWKQVERSGNVSVNYESVSFMPKNPKVPVIYENDPVEKTQENIPELHLLLNADGSYGGTTDASKYGNGTPLNGLYNHLDKNYHKFADIYNFENTNSRLVLNNYRAYQQTMASTCGICSTLSVLAYYGQDVVNLYNELYLMTRYQEITGKIIYNSGVGGSGLEDLIEDIGYQASYDSFAKASYEDISDTCFYTYEIFVKFVKMNLSKNTPMPISWRPHGGHWEVIIGYDDMGTDYIYDDVILLADSGDSWDHYQDGYNIIPATLFYRQWYNGSYTYNQQYVYFTKDSKQ